MPAFDALVVSCEHGGNRVPARYAALFRNARAVLASHRGWDPGALALARRLAHGSGAPLHAARVTRLLVDLNRSLGHPRVFSEFTAPLPAGEKQRIVARHYQPHRRAVAEAVARRVRAGRRTLHLAVHSFTPFHAGGSRRTDVALLYDPGRRRERALCARWRALLLGSAPQLRLRRNHPYRGRDDGLTTALRRRFGPRLYVGIELEVNQRHLVPGARLRPLIVRALAASLRELPGGPGARAGSG